MKPNRTALGRGLASLISSKPVSVVPPEISVDSQTSHSSSSIAQNAALQYQVSQNIVTFPTPTAAPLAVGSGESGMNLRFTEGSSAVAFPDTFSSTHGAAAATSTGRDAEIRIPETSIHEEGVRYLDISELYANPAQPRKEFAETELRELSDSIKTLGVLQPILVRARPARPALIATRGDLSGATSGDLPGATSGDLPGATSGYEIVAGERRFRAAQRAGLTKVPVIIRHLSEREVVEIALVENVQRADLSPLEEAYGYNRLSEDFGLTQREIAERVGKDRATIANFMRLITLPPTILEMMKKGDITMGHAKAILTVREPAVQINLARKVVSEGLSVRAIEAIVSRSVTLPNSPAKGKDSKRSPITITPEVAAIIDRLRGRLGTKVSVTHHVSGKGKIEIEYFSIQELERLIDVIGG